MEEIAPAAGVSPRSLFRHFASKNHLMAYALISDGDQMIAVIEGCPDGLPLREAFRRTVVKVAGDSVRSHGARDVIQMTVKCLSAAGAEMAGMIQVQARTASACARLVPEERDGLSTRILAGSPSN